MFSNKSEAVMAQNMRDDDAVIELTEMLTSDLGISDTEDEILELTEVVSDADDAGEASPETADLNALNISEEQVMTALERYFEKRFSSTIERTFLDVMEKVISKEIAEIRENLQKDLDQIIEN